MRALALTLFFASSVGYAQTDPDPWLGSDKALHFGVSAGLAGLGYAGTAFFTDDVKLRLIIGGAFSLSLGAAKELADLAGWGHPSWRDFTWDVIGTATGLVVAWLIDTFVITPLLVPAPAR